jgi:aminoglycoside phosphotransferase (APT) family kinase protein
VTELAAPILSWIEAVIGPGANVTSVREMPPWSVDMHELVVEAMDGTEHRLVLRRYSDKKRLGVDQFYDPANEVRALQLLERTDVPAPRLYGADLEPTVCDVPAVLESWVSGEPALAPRDVDAYLESAAESLVRIHAATPSRPEGLPDYVPYAIGDGIELRPPRWSGRAGLWDRVFDVLAGEAPETRSCFIHRDYHQGNILTEDDRVVSVIDWVTAAWGPPGIDLARMRLNLVEEVNIGSAQRFLEAYRTVGGDPDDRHPYWDLRDAADCVTDNPDRNDLEGHDLARFETWVAAILAEM